MRVVLVTLVCLVGCGLVSGLTKPTSIKLIDNGYSGIVVAIHRDVNESEALIQSIKDMFIEGSSYMFNATRRRAYFKSVTILIPKTWTTKPEYQQARNESYDNADVLIGPRPNPIHQTNPYTKQIQGCGKRGVNINFIEDFFLDPNTPEIYGPLGRVLIHEWGHYWWGLFDEYPEDLDGQFYRNSNRKYEGTRCSDGFEGIALIIDETTGAYRPCNGDSSNGYEAGCTFIATGSGDATGSIMYGKQFYEQVVDFCDKDNSKPGSLHNADAKNKHNRICRHKSCWEVMSETLDFKGGNNPPGKVSPGDLVPEFRFIQQGLVRVVLVLDVSGSMSGARFTKMVGACVEYIKSVALRESYVGIVQFNGAANILSHLKLLLTEDDRLELLEHLPLVAGGGTCIGCGLYAGIEVLTTFGDPSGGVILLLSDGEDDKFPSQDVIDALVNAGIIVDSIALGQTGEAGMEIVAVETGGKFFHSSETTGDSSLHDVLASTVSYADIPVEEKRVQLLSDSFTLQIAEEYTDSVIVDTTIGNKTEFDFQWTNAPDGQQGIYVELITPNGSSIDASYEGYELDITNKIVSIKIAGTAQPGTWTFIINNLAVAEEIFCTVFSYASEAGVAPIMVTSELSGTYTDWKNGDIVSIYAEVKQAENPIIHADVWAVVRQPNGAATPPFQLLDDGKRADITKNDGVYSAYFTQFVSEGFYGIKISIRNNGTAIIVGPGPYSNALPNLGPGDEPQFIGGYPVTPPWIPPKEPTGEPAPPFSRSTSGGSTNVPSVPPGYVPGDDVISPERISDLRVASTSYDEESVTLTWTATGDDADSGTVQFYDIRRANTTEKLLSNFLDATPITQSEIITGDLNAPQSSGYSEVFTIKVPVEGASTISYAFAITATDDVGLSSDTSNVAVATLRQYIPPTRPPPTLPWTTTKRPTTPTKAPVITSPASTSYPTTAKHETPALSLPQVIGIAVGCGVLVIIVVILIIASVCKSQKSKASKSQPDNMEKKGEINTVMSPEYESVAVDSEYETVIGIGGPSVVAMSSIYENTIAQKNANN